jgi:hypothetical protein
VYVDGEARSRAELIIRQAETRYFGGIGCERRAAGAVHHLVGERENEAGLTQKRKCRLLGPRLFGLHPAQQFIAGDDREGEPLVFGEIGPYPLQDERMLFEESERISVSSRTAG